MLASDWRQEDVLKPEAVLKLQHGNPWGVRFLQIHLKIRGPRIPLRATVLDTACVRRWGGKRQTGN